LDINKLRAQLKEAREDIANKANNINQLINQIKALKE
jgi:hypothetical protein